MCKCGHLELLECGSVEVQKFRSVKVWNCLCMEAGGGGEATRSGTEKRCSHNLQSGQSAS